MAKLSIVQGTTSLRSYVFIQDSSVTTGAGLTGLTSGTSNLVAYYVQPGGSATSITLNSQTATGAYSSGGFVAVDGTNMPGLYRFDIPNAALTGASSVVVMLKGAANMVPCVLEIELTAVDNQNAASFGVSRLDAAVSTRLATSGYTAPLDAAGTRTAVGLASANLDTQFAAIPSANSNADALLDRSAGVETGLTPRQAFRLMAAAVAGKLSGAATTTITIRNAVADSKARITATVDADGNRSAITYDVS